MKLVVRLYCWKCGFIDNVGKYRGYSVNLDAFKRIKCKNCQRIQWRLDIHMEKEENEMGKYTIKEIDNEGNETNLAQLGDLELAKRTTAIFSGEYIDHPDQYNISLLTITDETGERVHHVEVK